MRIINSVRRALLREPAEEFVLYGSEIRSLLRRHGMTIREFSLSTGITQKRVREVMATGLKSGAAARDWMQGITGVDPGFIGSV